MSDTMVIDFFSLAVIALVAALSPLVARAIPRRVVPETVILLAAGAVLGPNMLGFIDVDQTISFISELGLAFLFLLAGYEIDPKSIVGTCGRHAMATWLVSFLLAGCFIYVSGLAPLNSIEGIAAAIALTTTALGTLLPILKERGLMGTAIGDAVLSYGTWGELGPVIAMALLLTTRSRLTSIAILAGLAVLCVLLAVFAKGVHRYSTKVFQWVNEGSETTSQTYVRLTVLLLVLLLTFAEMFELDLVLGAFAAGFVLRAVAPEDHEVFELKIEGMAHGFFIPLFFVVSGAKVNLAAIGLNPMLMFGFIAMLLLIRALPVFVSLSLARETKEMAAASRASVSLYCATALPLIVAVTSVAVQSGKMTPDVASVLVGAGAVTVLVMPLLAMVFQWLADFHLVEAAKEVTHDPRHAGDIMHDHLVLGKIVHRLEEKEDRLASGRARLEDLVVSMEDSRLELMSEAMHARAARAEWVAEMAERERERLHHDYGHKDAQD